MADLSKLKRPNSLGVPPPLEEASRNLKAPETAPVVGPPAVTLPNEATPLKTPGSGNFVHARLDGRTLRKSGRTLQLATRVSPEFDDKLRHVAQRDGLKLVEVLELGLIAYEATRERRS